MAFRLISDLEKGIHVLLGGPEDPGLALDALEPDMRAAVEHFAEHTLGVGQPVSQAAGAVAADLISAAAEAIQHGSAAAPQSQAANTSTAEQQPPQAAASAATEPGIDTAPAPQADQTAGKSPAASIADQQGQQQQAETPEKETPVTEPKPGFVICPRCQGWRDVVGASGVVICPSCGGTGEVSAAQPGDAAAS